MMSKEKTFNNWQEVIVDFFERKITSELEKYIKEELKEIDKKFKKENYFNNQELEDFFNTKKNKPKKSQTSIDFQEEKLKHILSLGQKPTELNAEEIELKYQNKLDSITKKYTYDIWFSENSKKAKSVSFATHVVKLTHSKIDSPSFYDSISAKKDNQLTTSSLKNKSIDGAVAGNQFAPIFQFLELELNGKKLASEFADENNNILQDFVKNDNDLKKWNNGFKQSLSTKKISAHPLLKQIYFPVSNKNYHLLCNVKSSSMAHVIFENLLGKNEKLAKKMKRENKYSDVVTNSFYEQAKISTTKSNHSNASQLNGKRGGKINLFSTQPPTWKSQLKPPISKKSAFDNYPYQTNTKENIKYLVNYLLRFENIGLSIKNPEKRKQIEKWASCIIDDFLYFVSTINALPSSWSAEKNVKLKIEHQYLLDPYREDEKFQANKKDTDWQVVIVADFSNWLNSQLKNKDKKFTRQKEYSEIWKKLMEQELREYAQIITADNGVNDE
jgi:CRISPR-associated protein Csy1